jgi:hypothetical protein
MLLVLGIAGVRSSATGYRPSSEPTNGDSATAHGYLYMWKNVARWLRARHPKLGWPKIQRRFLTGYPARRRTPSPT